MKAHIALALLCLSLLSGCAGTTRVVTDTLSAGVGGGAANLLTKGNPIATAAGAAGGVLLGETLNYASANNANKARLEGYNKGRSDAVKQQYWVQVNQQKAAEDHAFDENISLFDIPIPEQRIDGVILKPTTKILRIEE
ncbi:MAG: hypothetical protein ABI680_11125 [Chthoniobacteraceae bacterium]